MRYLFYAVTCLSLVYLLVRQHTLMVSWREQRERERLEHEALQLEQIRLSSIIVRKKSVIEAGVIGLNVIIAIRGLLYWTMIRNMGVEMWIRKVAMQWPTYERATRVIKWTTLPVRAPFLALQARRQARLAAILEQAARLERQSSLRGKLWSALPKASSLPWHRLGVGST